MIYSQTKKTSYQRLIIAYQNGVLNYKAAIIAYQNQVLNLPKTIKTIHHPKKPTPYPRITSTLGKGETPTPLAQRACTFI